MNLEGAGVPPASSPVTLYDTTEVRLVDYGYSEIMVDVSTNMGLVKQNGSMMTYVSTIADTTLGFFKVGNGNSANLTFRVIAQTLITMALEFASLSLLALSGLVLISRR